MIRPDDSNLIRVEESEVEHTHEPTVPLEGALKLTQPAKEFIAEQMKLGRTAQQIRIAFQDVIFTCNFFFINCCYSRIIETILKMFPAFFKFKIKFNKEGQRKLQNQLLINLKQQFSTNLKRMKTTSTIHSSSTQKSTARRGNSFLSSRQKNSSNWPDHICQCTWTRLTKLCTVAIQFL